MYSAVLTFYRTVRFASDVIITQLVGQNFYSTHNTALINNEINSNLNNKVSETTYRAITESRLRVAKIISQ